MTSWAVPPAAAAAEPPPLSDRLLPIGAEWAREKGIDLPSPFGVGLFLINMRRDIEVTDIRVGVPGGSGASVSDVGTFAVRNNTTLAAVKVDAWIFPVLNVYLLGGQSWTDSRLDASITIDPIVGPPEVVTVSQSTPVGGPLLGGGATAVAGYGRWFALVDANLNYSWIDGVENTLLALFVSARTGWSGTTGWGSWRGWIGGAWLGTSTTLIVHQKTSIGTLEIDVDQRPVHPFTLQIGGSASFGKRWDALLEVGSNFDDAFVGVLSAAYRF